VRRPLLSTALAVLIGGAILAWLLSGTSLETIREALERVPLWRVAAAIILIAVVQWFRAWRFAILIAGDVRAPSLALIRVVLQLLLFNFLLPFKLGEVAFPVLMRRAIGTDIGHAVGHLLLARAFDVAVVVGLMLLAAAAVPGGVVPAASAPLLVLLALLALASPTVLVVLLVRLRGVARARSATLQRLTEGAATTRRSHLLLALTGSSLAIWCIHIAAALLIAEAVAPAVDLAALAMGNAASHLAFALPVPAIAGLGAPQAAWVAALTLTGVDWSSATAVALVTHGVVILAVILLAAVSVVPWPGQGRLSAKIDDAEYIR
jgi:hypothetical protein